MSTPPIQPPPAVKVERPCMACGQIMTYMMPVLRIFNAVDVSNITLLHYRPDICRSCKAMFLPVVVGVDDNGAIQLEWKPCSAGKAPIVVGAGASELQKAIENANLAEKLRREGN